jgi:hypothetical protein
VLLTVIEYDLPASTVARERFPDAVFHENGDPGFDKIAIEDLNTVFQLDMTRGYSESGGGAQYLYGFISCAMGNLGRKIVTQPASLDHQRARLFAEYVRFNKLDVVAITSNSAILAVADEVWSRPRADINSLESMTESIGMIPVRKTRKNGTQL